MNAEMDNRSPLVGATFRVVAIDGLPVLPAPLADLSFDAEGNVGGCATINRLRGQYSLEGGALTFGPLASTMMAGPQEARRPVGRLTATRPADPAASSPKERKETPKGRG